MFVEYVKVRRMNLERCVVRVCAVSGGEVGEIWYTIGTQMYQFLRFGVVWVLNGLKPNLVQSRRICVGGVRKCMGFVA